MLDRAFKMKRFFGRFSLGSNFQRKNIESFYKKETTPVFLISSHLIFAKKVECSPRRKILIFYVKRIANNVIVEKNRTPFLFNGLSHYMD